jgi:hypothetical protein
MVTLQRTDRGLPMNLPEREHPQGGAVGQLFGLCKAESACLCQRKLGERLPLDVSPIFPGVSCGDFLYVLFSDLLGLLQFGKYSEFRAYKTTETALHAVFSLEDQFRRVIALGIKTLALL